MSIADAMQQLAAKDIADIKREWSKYNVAGNAYITFKITQDTPMLVEGRYDAKGMKMWTLEYGSGSKMDLSNPHLEEYMRSQVYNSKRGQAPRPPSQHGTTEIRTRHNPYYDIDAPTHNRQEGSEKGFSKDWKWGLNAEWLRAGHDVKPIEPHHIIKDIVPRKNTVHKQEFRANVLKAIRDELRGVMKD